MLLFQPKNEPFVEFCRQQLLSYKKPLKSHCYEGSIDIQLQYFLLKATNSDDVLEKFSGRLTGSIQLVIAEFYLSKNVHKLGLHYLVKAIACEDNDINTMDAIGLWLSDMPAEVGQQLNEELKIAIIQNKPKSWIAAIEHALLEL
jgi:hypothetical protein